MSGSISGDAVQWSSSQKTSVWANLCRLVSHAGIMMHSCIEKKSSKLQGSTTAQRSDDSVLVICSVPFDMFGLNPDSRTAKKVGRFRTLDINISYRLTVSGVVEPGWPRYSRCRMNHGDSIQVIAVLTHLSSPLRFIS